MGRYTTVQTYSDKNAKVASVPYELAKAQGSAADGGDAAAEKGDGKHAHDAAEGEPDRKKSKMSTMERVNNVMGSCAGAGSGEFHMYRNARRREMHRVAAIEAEARETKIRAEFEEKLKHNRESVESKTAKKAEKRRRRKQAKKAKGGKKAQVLRY
ncbi:unnamed protein product [Chrysoparadoxa australica]